MTDKLLKAQERVLRAMHTRNVALIYSTTPAVRMQLRVAGLVDYGNETWEITAKGLRAIGATAELIYEREKLERERDEKAIHDEWLRKDQAAKREVNRKAKIIAKVRTEFDFMFCADTDAKLWEAITRIVEIHEGTA